MFGFPTKKELLELSRKINDYKSELRYMHEQLASLTNTVDLLAQTRDNHLEFNHSTEMLSELYKQHTMLRDCFIEFYSKTKKCSKQSAVQAVAMLVSKMPAPVVTPDEWRDALEK
jgi:hypothetical protein